MNNHLKIVEDGDDYIATRDYKLIYNIKLIGDRWVAMDQDLNIIDKDQFRYDLFERLKLL